MEGGRSAWLKLVMSVKRKHPKMSLGDAMKSAAKLRKTRKGRRGGAYAPSTDGHAAQLPYASASVAPETALGVNGTFSASGATPKSNPLGGRRRRSRRTRRRTLYGGDNTKGSAMVYGASATEAHKAATAAAAARNGYE